MDPLIIKTFVAAGIFGVMFLTGVFLLIRKATGDYLFTHKTPSGHLDTNPYRRYCKRCGGLQFVESSGWADYWVAAWPVRDEKCPCQKYVSD